MVRFNIFPHLVSSLICLLALSPMVQADNAGTKSIRIEGRKSAVVTTTQVRLGDIAEISSRQIEDDEAVIGLQKVIIGESPAPGQRTTFTAHRILERLGQEGVALSRVGYVIPRVVTVERAARQLTESEVIAVIHDFLVEQGREITIRQVKLDAPVYVAPGDISFKVRPEGNVLTGQLGFQLLAQVAGEQPVSFRAQARYDEWLMVPVARRPLTRGSVVEQDDVMMARMNVGALPRDSRVELKQIIGQQVDGDLGIGDTFRSNRLALPAVVSAGSRVTLLYKTNLLEASATGVALESASQDQEVRVRNVNSKKIVTGRAVESGLVIVGP